MRSALLVTVVLIASMVSGRRASANPFAQDPLGPVLDVTDSWTDYQPADAFCVRPDVFEFSGDSGADADGTDPACALSGFASSDTGLYRVELDVPPLCAGCRRIFIDYAQIPATNDPPYYYARGKVYFHLRTPNPGWTIDPVAHSPNIKNFTNDKAVAPEDTPQETLIGAFDNYARSYTGDVWGTAHTERQGPWYVGPWYVNRDGERINGAYLDVEVMGSPWPNDPTVPEIGYMAGFNSGEATCPDNVLFDGQYRDGNYFYGGCTDRWGSSAVLWGS